MSTTITLGDLEVVYDKVSKEHLYLDSDGSGASATVTLADGETTQAITAINGATIPLTTGLRTYLDAGTASAPSAIVNVEEGLQKILSLQTTASTLNSGTYAQRPSSPASGAVRFNTTVSRVEMYNGTKWVFLDSKREEYSMPSGATTKTVFNQTELTSSFSFISGEIQVFVNGVLQLESGAYTEGSESNGVITQITFSNGLVAEDNLTVIF